MSSNVCQGGLQSCLDFNLFNNSPLGPVTDSEVHKEENNVKSNDNIDMGGWSFLQSLTNSSEFNNKKKKEAIENEKVYVHPLQNRSSSSRLSTKSLEMCTESLGSETGSNCSEISDEFHFTSSLEKVEPKYYKNWVTKKRILKRSTSFPPPLTSMSGVQLRHHREGGRLVLKAQSVSSCLTYFQAERSGGRLRLRLLQNCSPNCNCHEKEEEEEEEVETEAEKLVLDVRETEEAEETEEEEEEEEENRCVKVRGETGAEKVSVTSRCKEGEHGLPNWEPFWVAS